ncbi:MAG: bifunctional phosphoribosylaminoimidazolecarboxamide formyltransferase/IMP cyclohydrolase [Nitrospinae bacterium]|nr:bifunctional phosphoribosylaminoimidazolecarboxamide formyltransferase/IMP cyclohydrolase [Nitrospinota bacterium]
MSGKRRAIISVSDKRGAAELGAALTEAGWEVLSTGGTAKSLRDAGVPVREVSDYTGQPEIMGGRVKTLHPKVLGGILALLPDQEEEMRANDIAPIDLVAVNLYPFRETVAKPGVTREEAVEQIDIGGPTMVRAASKNHGRVAVLVDPDDYPDAIAHVRNGGHFPADWLAGLALKAFRHTASYDAAISGYLGDGDADALPERIEMNLDRVQTLRYGENPHQKGALYRLGGRDGFSLCDAEILGGKELSFNNLLDAAAAAELAHDLEGVGCAIIKHTNPCGVGLGDTQAAAYERALACDPVSAFGSVIGYNRKVDAHTAEAMRKLFVEAVVAPDFDDDALAIMRKKKNLRILRLGGLGGDSAPAGPDMRSIPGGMLLQERDRLSDEEFRWEVVTPRAPSAEEEKALRIAWCVARHVKSNAIVMADKDGTVGVGAGQMSRVDSTRLAAERAVLPLEGCALGSDAFFPFRDGIDAAASHGVKAIAQPGGSMRDEEVIEAAAGHDIAMVFTGRRHFRH